MAIAYPPILPFIENGLPFVLAGAPPGHVHYQPSLNTIPSPSRPRQRSSQTRSSRRRSSPQSISPASSASPTTTSGNLRLADLAKHHCMGVHTEAWREDMLPVRQCLPLQQIIGSLKRDRDADTVVAQPRRSYYRTTARRSSDDDVSSASPMSDDSFLQSLRTPKRRRTLDSSMADSPATQYSDFDRRFSHQLDFQVPKEIPRAALPGLNHVLNLSTVTPDERNIFSEYAPENLEDPQLLMNEVLQQRHDMMDEQNADDVSGDFDHATSFGDATSPILPPERDVEVRKAFEEFIDFNDSKRYIAKI